jgi:polyisoprenoid-binding protein YceI
MKLLNKPDYPMNIKTSLRYLLLFAPLFFTGCGQAVKEGENKSEVNPPESISVSNNVIKEKYVIDLKESVVTWSGSNLFPPGGHTGYVYISKGELLIDKDQIVGGTIEIDMNTIADKDHGSKNNLVDHLKNPDFFDVEKFPFSTFNILTVIPRKGSAINVTGNLTIKGITLPVTFPATLDFKDGAVNANGKLAIDRTQWDIRYKSNKFFANLADQAISDSIKFEMKIVARK